MGSIDRKIQRTQQKLGYKQFCKAFANVQQDQRQRLESGTGLKPGEHQLVYRPTLAQYLARVKQLTAEQQIAKAKAEVLKEQEEKNVDREWKDE